LQALIMLPPSGNSEAERWVAAGRMACAQDLVDRLLKIDAIDRIIAVVAEEQDKERLASLGVDSRLSSERPFDFGTSLAELIAAEGIQQLAYFGGASAPLLEANMIAAMVEKVHSSTVPFAIVNNLHSTDWLLINQADRVLAHSHRFPSDNSLGWVLSNEAEVVVEATEPTAATRLDIDTPTDLFLTMGHRAVGPALADFLIDIPSEIKAKMNSVRRILNSPASTLTLIGRASAHVWQQLVANTQIWVRLFVEERGMVASHRLARGEVQSLIGQMLDMLGPGEFVERLGGMADAVLWDTRVWMGTLPEWPSNADRFAADLGWVDAIQDSDLRKLSEAVESSRIPILSGGYGVVGGGLYALLETLSE
jgi:CTP:molybdopterin cytidylyltransferase MocA